MDSSVSRSHWTCASSAQWIYLPAYEDILGERHLGVVETWKEGAIRGHYSTKTLESTLVHPRNIFLLPSLHSPKLLIYQSTHFAFCWWGFSRCHARPSAFCLCSVENLIYKLSSRLRVFLFSFPACRQFNALNTAMDPQMRFVHVQRANTASGRIVPVFPEVSRLP